MYVNSKTGEHISHLELRKRYPDISFPETIAPLGRDLVPADEFDPPDDWEHYIPAEPPPPPPPEVKKHEATGDKHPTNHPTP